MLTEQQSKPADQRDIQLELQIMDAAARFNKRLTALQNGSPIIAQMKSALEGKNVNPLTSEESREREYLASLMTDAHRQEQEAIAQRQREEEQE